MDVTRVTSPPSIIVNDFNGQNGSYRPASKPAGMSFSSTRAPMQIPNVRGEPAPPPLPPPTHIVDLAAGSDPGWVWGNTSSGGNFGKSGGTVSMESSLRGNWDRRREDDGSAVRPDYARRGSSVSTVKSPTEVEPKYDFSRHQDEGYYSLSGASNLANYQSVQAFQRISFGRLVSVQSGEKSSGEISGEDCRRCFESCMENGEEGVVDWASYRSENKSSN